MKILIGYDNSEFSKIAIEYLLTAGLPDGTKAVVVSIARALCPVEVVRRAAGSGSD